jgi:hypothetical protein
MVHRFRFDLVEANQNIHLPMHNNPSFQHGRLMQHFSLNCAGYILWNTKNAIPVILREGDGRDMITLLNILDYSVH